MSQRDFHYKSTKIMENVLHRATMLSLVAVFVACVTTTSAMCVKSSLGHIVCGPEQTACVETEDGTIVCGEAVAKQPATVEDADDAESTAVTPDTEPHSGYTSPQLEWSRAEIAMPYRHLGRTGLRVSALSFGTWITFGFQNGKQQATDIIRAAYDAGINTFDTAEAYGGGEAEKILGEVIKDGIDDGIWRREDLVVITKVYWGRPVTSVNDVGLSRKHVIEGTLASLKRLGLEYVDVVFAHRPDEHTPLEETVRAFNHLIDTGRVFYWGTSMWPAAKIQEAQAIAHRLGLVPPVVEQPEYSLLKRDRMELEYADLFARSGYGTTIYSPLALGVLTGKYNDGIPDDSRFTVKAYDKLRESVLDGSRLGDWDDLVGKLKRLRHVADGIGATLAQLAIAWCLKNKDVSSVLLGARTVSQLHENLAAITVAERMTPNVLAQIEAIMGNAPQAVKETDFVQVELDKIHANLQ